jgi:hypothetical protein
MKYLRLLFFGILFTGFSFLTWDFSNKDLIVQEKKTREFVEIPQGGGSIESDVFRQYYNNYASIGGAIGFALLSAVSLISFAKELRELDASSNRNS